MDWKTYEKGVPLVRTDGSAVVDMDGLPVLATGAWADPNNITQLGSALRAIHQKFMHRGAYQGVCASCLHERSMTPPNRFGCDRHTPQPQIWRKGIPTESIAFENAFKRILKDMKDYKPNGDTQLTPTEVLIIRDYCMKEDSAYHFMVYTIFITFVKLFMRNDDGQNLEFADFEESFFVVSNFVISVILSLLL
jgi:hypothetical protein